MNSGERFWARMISLRIANPTPPWPFFPPPSPPPSPLQYTTYPASTRADWPLRRVSCSPMMSQSRSSYSLRTSAARPAPCFPSTAIVRTLWVAIVSSFLRTFSLSLSASRLLARRPALPLCLRFLARSFFLLVVSVLIFCFFCFLYFSGTLFLLSPSPFAPKILVSRDGFGRPQARDQPSYNI